jgi:methionyl-tRNA formyltransferase
MKIVILTVDDYIFLPIFFRKFLKERAHSVQRIIILSPKGYYRSLRRAAQELILLYGVPGSLRLCGLVFLRRCASCLARILRKPALASSVKTLAQLYGISYFQTSDIGDSEVIKRIKSDEPDMILSVTLPQKIPAVYFSIPKQGIFNIHTSLLPAYRGVLPVFWALLNGDTTIGVTLHKIDENIDAGEIIFQDSFTVQDDDSLERCIAKGKALGADTALKFLNDIEEGKTLASRKFDVSQTRYYSFPSASDIKRFKKKRRLF